jgi:hypothetical protein
MARAAIATMNKTPGAPVSDPARFKTYHQRAGSETGAPFLGHRIRRGSR